MGPVTRILFAFGVESRGFETDSSDEGVEIVDDTLVEAIELRSPLGLKPGICFDRVEKASRKWRVDAFEEFQEDQADRVALREQLITARVGQLGNQAFGAEFCEVVAERGERVV